MIKTIKLEGCVRDNIKIWGAKIIGVDRKYGFKREFKSFRYLNYCSSNFAYYDYYIDVEENDIIEVGEKSKFKNKRIYYIFKDNILISITLVEIFKKIGAINVLDKN